MKKLLLHLTARHHKREELSALLCEKTESWTQGLAGDSVRATVLQAHVRDPMRRTGLGENARAFDASLEIQLEGGPEEQPFGELLKEMGSAAEPLAQRDLCAAQVGADHVFMPCAPTPVRYQYCMRRRHDYSDAGYLKRYAELHSRFGLETRGIEGYTQFHIDPSASEVACETAGFGISRVNSVSQLHMASLETFFAAGEHNAALGAPEDEDEFVDRANSVMWVSDEILRIGFD